VIQKRPGNLLPPARCRVQKRGSAAKVLPSVGLGSLVILLSVCSRETLGPLHRPMSLSTHTRQSLTMAAATKPAWCRPRSICRPPIFGGIINTRRISLHRKEEAGYHDHLLWGRLGEEGSGLLVGESSSTAATASLPVPPFPRLSLPSTPATPWLSVSRAREGIGCGTAGDGPSRRVLPRHILVSFYRFAR
jgi:hypothetical protein